MQREQLLCWSGMTDTEHSTTYSSNEEMCNYVLYNCNLRHSSVQVFLDVIESVNLLVSANGNVLRSEIVGSVKMRVFLTGMPELRLGLNDKVLFQNTGSKWDLILCCSCNFLSDML